MRMMEILDARKARATFFVLGWVAEKCPDLVRTIAAAGHEVASHGYGHEHVYSLRPSEFRSDVLRSKRYLEDLTGKAVRGYRAPCFSITEWAIPILQDAGFDYDSSVVPTVAHDRYGRLNGMHAGRPIVSLREGFYEVRHLLHPSWSGKAWDPLGRRRLFSARSLRAVALGRACDPALRDALHLLHPPVGDRSGPTAGGRDQYRQWISPTRQPPSVRRAIRLACWRFRMDADLRSHRPMEGESQRAAALDGSSPALLVQAIENGHKAPRQARAAHALRQSVARRRACA